MDQDNKLRTIHKTRYCLSTDSQYFEIDIFPEWNNQAIMEIELSSEDQEVVLPSFIHVIKEVTDDTVTVINPWDSKDEIVLTREQYLALFDQTQELINA